MESNNLQLDYEYLESLLQTVGVSGYESQVCKSYLSYVSAYVNECDIDVMGNGIAIIQGESNGKKILIEAHADEIGFQVLHIGETGFLYVRRNGGVDEQCLPGSKVVVQTRTGELIPGVIGKKPIHLMSTDDRKRTIEIHQVWVDTGLEIDEIKEKISIGDPVAFAPSFTYLGKYKISGKSLDNKIGVFIVAQVLKSIDKLKIKDTIGGVATAQEEVGSRGAVTIAYHFNPEIAITIDVDFSTDVPDCTPSRYGSIKLGAGVIIPYNADVCPQLSCVMQSLAKEKDIPFQISARPHATGGTNTSRIQLTQSGIRTISLGIPCRYMHTPVEICDLRDVEAAVRLIVEYLKRGYGTK